MMHNIMNKFDLLYFIVSSKERSQILEHYKNIWRDYEAKYKSFPLAKTLQTLQTENRHLEEQLKEKENDCGKLRKQLACLSGNVSVYKEKADGFIIADIHFHFNV